MARAMTPLAMAAARPGRDDSQSPRTRHLTCANTGITRSDDTQGHPVAHTQSERQKDTTTRLCDRPSREHAG